MLQVSEGCASVEEAAVRVAVAISTANTTAAAATAGGGGGGMVLPTVEEVLQPCLLGLEGYMAGNVTVRRAGARTWGIGFRV